MADSLEPTPLVLGHSVVNIVFARVLLAVATPIASDAELTPAERIHVEIENELRWLSRYNPDLHDLVANPLRNVKSLVSREQQDPLRDSMCESKHRSIAED